SGAAAAELAAAMKAGTFSAANAVTTIEAEARLAHTSIDAALVALDTAAGGNTVVETEMAARLSGGAAATDLAAVIAAGTMTAASAITTIEALAQKSHNSIDAALVSLDHAAGGNAAVEAEMATRVSSGAAAT